MSAAEWLVLLGGLAAIGWVNWYFFLAERGAARAEADALTPPAPDRPAAAATRPPSA